MAIPVAEPLRRGPVYRQVRRPGPQTVCPAQLVAPSGNGAPLSPLPCRTITDFYLNAEHPPEKSQETGDSPFKENGRPGRWIGSTGYPLYFVKQQLSYREEGISLQPDFRYEAEPLEPLFGLDHQLPDLPAAHTWANVRPRPAKEMFEIPIEDILHMPIEEFMMRYFPDKLPITDQQMIDGLQWNRRGNRSVPIKPHSRGDCLNLPAGQ